ncbi:unnamed protein product, partial [Ectocarpus fasciculatus]
GCFFIADGWCDSSHNTAECGWDGGDCCECDCVDADYTCGVVGYDCLDPSACGSGGSVGAIVGGVIGALVFVVAVIVLAVLFKKGHLKPCACGDSCACCEPVPPSNLAPAPAPAPAGVGLAPSVVKGYPEVYNSSAAVAQPPPPAYEGPGNDPTPGVQAYPVAAANAPPPAYDGGPVRNQYPAPV